MDLSGKIDVVENISEQAFRKNYLNLQKPLVMKGLAYNEVAGRKWSIPYFKSTMGEFAIDVFDNGNKKTAGSAFTKPDLKMKFKDFLDVISKDEPSSLRMFLFNLFKYNPELKKEFPCPRFFRGLLSGMAYMFFGGKNTTVRIHQDIDMSHVLHTHFGGRKRVVLIAPEYSTLLYRLPLNTYSLVNLDKPDYKTYPALQFIKGAEVILEPGDSIFMPAGYWHYMTYLEGSFSASYRKLPNALYVLCGIRNLVIFLPLDKALNKLLGKHWLGIKVRIAKKRAERVMNKNRMPYFDDALGI
ncbi:cupin [Sphingobacteriaceae bacterium]|nr:cupin [Sphingobacteriaceae bacterium]